jgi:hypothetical protein
MMKSMGAPLITLCTCVVGNLWVLLHFTALKPSRAGLRIESLRSDVFCVGVVIIEVGLVWSAL